MEAKQANHAERPDSYAYKRATACLKVCTKEWSDMEVKILKEGLLMYGVDYTKIRAYIED